MSTGTGGARPRRVAVPARILGAGLLDDVGYADAFSVDAPVEVGSGHTAEDLVVIAAGAAPRGLLRAVEIAQRRTLGFRLVRTDPLVPIRGWQRVSSAPDEVVLGADGGLVTARLVVTKGAGRIVATTLVRYETRAARAVWTVVSVAHRLVARILLRGGARQLVEGARREPAAHDVGVGRSQRE